jgi:hypothetical protein
MLMLRASLRKVVHTVRRAGTYAAKVSLQELQKIAVRERAVVRTRLIFILNISGAFFTQIVWRISPHTVRVFPVLLAPQQ